MTRNNDISLFQGGQTISVTIGNGDTISFQTSDITDIIGEVDFDSANVLDEMTQAISKCEGILSVYGDVTSKLEIASGVLDKKVEEMFWSSVKIADVDVAKETASKVTNDLRFNSSAAIQVHASDVTKIATMLL